MDSYIDVKIKPDSEMRENVLVNKVYTKLHKALHALNTNSLGISFPEYKILLGRVIRVHGSQSDLSKLQGLNWLGGLIGYCDITYIKPVPDNVCYRTISRVQSNMSQAKLNRLIKRGSISQQEAKDYRKKMFTKGLDNPYVELESTSNGLKYRRYFQFSPLLEQSAEGGFDTFGTSRTATVPWF